MHLNTLNQVVLICVACAIAAMVIVRVFQWFNRRNPAGQPHRPGKQSRLAAKVLPMARTSTKAGAPRVVEGTPLPSVALPLTPGPSTSAVGTPARSASEGPKPQAAPLLSTSPRTDGPNSKLPGQTSTGREKQETNTPRPAPSLPMIEADETPLADGSDYAFGPITSLLAALLPESDERRQANKKALRNAGYYEPHAWHNLAAARYLGVIVPIILCLGLLLVAPPELEPWLIGGIVVLPMLGWSLPTLHVRRQAAERLAEIERSMPDLLDMMNMCVSQGMTVPASLQRVGSDIESVSPALSKELKIVTEHARVGSLEQALVAFSKRVDRPEVYSFTSLLIQTERMGTSMSHALAEYSDSMRETLRQQADQKANTASFKLLFPTVLCLMPAVFMILLGPAIIEMSTFFREGGNSVLNSSMDSATDILER